MKGKKDCSVMACCWNYRHELSGLILLVIATLLTVFTGSSLGIFAMFLVGLVLYCHKFWSCHRMGQEDCGSSQGDCHSSTIEKDAKPQKKK
jgi:hypothetical protein